MATIFQNPFTNDNRIDSADPLYLHFSDHPGMVLVSMVFNGLNYHGWKRAVTIALIAKNKLGFVDGSVAKPENTSSAEARAWERCDNMVTSWLMNILDRDIAASVLYASNAHDLWTQLEERFAQANGAQIYALQKSLVSMSQGSDSVSLYYTKMKKTWDELHNAHGLPNCAHCLPNVNRYEQEQHLIQFLMGLNETYSNARGAILMMHPLPTVQKAYALISQEESQREIYSNQSLTNPLRSMSNHNMISNLNNNLNGKITNLLSRNITWFALIAIGLDILLIDVTIFMDFLLVLNSPREKKLAAANQVLTPLDNTASATDASSVPGLTVEEYNQMLSFFSKGKEFAATCFMAGINSISLASFILKPA